MKGVSWRFKDTLQRQIEDDSSTAYVNVGKGQKLFKIVFGKNAKLPIQSADFDPSVYAGTKTDL